MGEHHISCLDLKVKTDDSMIYHDDGFVEDTRVHMVSLFNKYFNSGFSQKDIYGIERTWGGTFMNRKPGEKGVKHVHIFYENNSKKQYPWDIFSRGHEETHALDANHLDQLDVLLQDMVDNGISDEGFYELSLDDQSNVGGIYAIFKYGLKNKIDSSSLELPKNSKSYEIHNAKKWLFKRIVKE